MGRELFNRNRNCSGPCLLYSTIFTTFQSLTPPREAQLIKTQKQKLGFNLSFKWQSCPQESQNETDPSPPIL